MKSKFVSVFTMLILISMLVGCAKPTPAPTEAPQPTQAAAPTKPPAAAEPTKPAAPAAPAGVEDFQADPTNLFPNGIGEVDCTGVNLVVATQTGPQIASPMENNWKAWGEKTGGTVEVQTFPFGDLFEKIHRRVCVGSQPVRHHRLCLRLGRRPCGSGISAGSAAEEPGPDGLRVPDSDLS